MTVTLPPRMGRIVTRRLARPILFNSLELMHTYLAEFGLTPASRLRVTAMPSLMPKPWEY